MPDQGNMENSQLIKLMSDETLITEANDSLEVLSVSSIENFHLLENEFGFYSLVFNDKNIDFPKSWSVFSSLTDHDFVDISDDPILVQALNQFFGDVSNYRLSKTSNGLYMIKTPCIKKAA